MAKTLTLRLDDNQEKHLESLMAHMNIKTASKALSASMETYIDLDEANTYLSELLKSKNEKIHLLEQRIDSAREAALNLIDSTSQQDIFDH